MTAYRSTAETGRRPTGSTSTTQSSRSRRGLPQGTAKPPPETMWVLVGPKGYLTRAGKHLCYAVTVDVIHAWAFLSEAHAVNEAKRARAITGEYFVASERKVSDLLPQPKQKPKQPD